jgi:hypothetical protein
MDAENKLIEKLIFKLLNKHFMVDDNGYVVFKEKDPDPNAVKFKLKELRFLSNYLDSVYGISRSESLPIVEKWFKINQ